MQQHPLRGARILEPIGAYARMLPIVAEHHERWDGSGYPRGLRGEAIALTARILAVADSYDAIKSDRPYRVGLSADRAYSVIATQSGVQFDPAVVEALGRVVAAMSHEPDKIGVTM
jgi:HD-GYP domain-containing protein (c-di-GMP phosphodiesterase class II)